MIEGCVNDRNDGQVCTHLPTNRRNSFARQMVHLSTRSSPLLARTVRLDPGLDNRKGYELRNKKRVV